MTRPESVPNPDPGSDGAAGPAPALPASRRAFIAGAGAVTVAGAAAVAAGTAAASASAATAAGAAATVTTAGEGSDSTGRSGPAVVAYVRDLTSGEVRVMSGEREVVVRDRALARTLAHHVDTHHDSKEG